MTDPSRLAVEIPSSDADPVAELISDPKGIGSRIADAEAKDHMFDIPMELVHRVKLVSSSNLDNATKDNDPIDDEKTLTASNPKHDHPEPDTSAQDNILKKPEQILPCPRCNSSNTKFCYYNNHNVNQPRHFCKNCQRYWTAGGTMRNVPVGAGRRKTKHFLQRQAHSEAFSVSMRPPMGNVAIIEHGPDLPSCNPITSDLSLGGQQNAKMVVGSGKENSKEPSCSFPVTSNCPASDCGKYEAHKEQTGSPGCSGGLPAMHSLQGFPGPPWPLSRGCNDVSAMAPSRSSENGIPDLFPWVAPLFLTAPALCVPTVPFPIMPPSFWACISSWPNEALSAPWRGSVNGLSPSLLAKINEGSPGNDSRTLGKHSRDGSLQQEEMEERKTLWLPKTLRIDDPEEAAKSSIWSTLGIKPNESIKRGSLFRGFQSNNENSGYASNAAQVLHANPSALLRSQTFQERA